MKKMIKMILVIVEVAPIGWTKSKVRVFSKVQC